MSLYNEYNSEIQRRLIDTFENDKDSNKEKKITMNNLIIYSLDRNWWGTQEKTFNYNLQFDNTTSNLSTLNQFRNIKSIYIDTVIMPNFYNNLLDLHGAFSTDLIKLTDTEIQTNSNVINFERLSDLPFISIKMNETNNNYGTNNSLNESSAILIVDSIKPLTNNNSGSLTYATGEPSKIYSVGNYGNNLIPGNNINSLILKNISKKKIYNPNKSTLSELNIAFHKPNGEEINLINNILSLKSVQYETTTKSLLITMNEYFSPEEYRIGDKILIKDLNKTDFTNMNLKRFLEREPGHTIVKHNGLVGKMYNRIDIPIDYQLNESTGVISINFNSVDTNSLTLTGGKLINANNQHIISMVIETETYINSFNSKLL